MKKNFLKIIFGLTAFLLFILPNPWILPKNNGLFALTIEEERKLGDQVVREVESKYHLIWGSADSGIS